MKNNILYTVLLSGILIASCSVPQEEVLPAKGREIRLSGVIGNYTKASDEGFASGDIVGLSISAPVEGISNIQLTAGENGALIPDQPIFWGGQQKEDETATFRAIYPYGFIPDMPFIFTLWDNQSLEGGYEATDLLYAVTDAAPKDENVLLHFTHAMSRLVLKLDNSLVGESVRTVWMNGVKISVEVDLVEGTFNAVGTEDTNIIPVVAGVEPSESLPGSLATTYLFLVAPQTATPDIWILLESEKLIHYTADAPINFVSGKQVKASINLCQDEVTFTGTIEEWDPSLECSFEMLQDMTTVENEWQVVMTTYWDGEETAFEMDRSEDGVYSASIEDYQRGAYLKLWSTAGYEMFDAKRGDMYPCKENVEVQIPLTTLGEPIVLDFTGDIDLTYDPKEGFLRVMPTADKRVGSILECEAGENRSVNCLVTSIEDFQIGDFWVSDDTGANSLRIVGIVNAEGKYPKDLRNGWENDDISLVPGDVILLSGTTKKMEGAIVLTDVTIQKRFTINPIGLLSYPNTDLLLDEDGDSQTVIIRNSEEIVFPDYHEDWLTYQITGSHSPEHHLWEWSYLTVTAEANPNPNERVFWMDLGSHYASFQIIQKPGSSE